MGPGIGLAWVSFLFLSFLLPVKCLAMVTGACGNCHIMHASQLGIAKTPNRWLTTSDCLGCHTGTNSASGTTPFVLTTGAADLTGALAGGNFEFS